MLDRLMLYRQAIEETDIDGALKRQMLHEFDATRQKFEQTIRETAGSPFKQREEAVKAVLRQFNTYLKDVGPPNSPVTEALVSRMLQVRREIYLLRDGKQRFAETGLRAVLDARQTTAVDALFAWTALKLSEPAPDDGRSPSEYHMEVLLAARSDLRWQLTDGQWHKLGTVLAEKDAPAQAVDKQPRAEFRQQLHTRPAESAPPGPL